MVILSQSPCVRRYKFPLAHIRYKLSEPRPISGMGINEVNPQKWMLTGAIGVRMCVTLVPVTMTMLGLYLQVKCNSMDFFSCIEYKPYELGLLTE